MSWLAVGYGALVGLSLGLTGGGGAIFAVPLLVYGLGVSTREAALTSLAAVGAISLFGMLAYWRLKLVDLRTGVLFAVAGMAGAPVGTWVATMLPDTVILLSFTVVMIVVAVRMWKHARRREENCPSALGCTRDPEGEIILTLRCAILLILVGLVTGVLSGLYGIGGGFIIVPTLVLLTGMSMQRAIGTSLMVIVLVSISGVASQAISGQVVSFDRTGWFTVGGISGMFVGQALGNRLSGAALQKVFVIAILAVALFVIVRNLDSWT